MKISHRCTRPDYQVALKGFIQTNSAEKANFHQLRCWNSILNCCSPPFIFSSNSLNACPILWLRTTLQRHEPILHEMTTTRNSTATPALAQSHWQALSLEVHPCTLTPGVPASRAERQRSFREARATEVVQTGAHCPVTSLKVIFRRGAVFPKYGVVPSNIDLFIQCVRDWRVLP